MGLRSFFLPNFPGAMFIQGATFIPDSRVVPHIPNRELKMSTWASYSTQMRRESGSVINKLSN